MIVLPTVKHSYIYDAERKSMIIGGEWQVELTSIIPYRV